MQKLAAHNKCPYLSDRKGKVNGKITYIQKVYTFPMCSKLRFFMMKLKCAIAPY